MIGKESIAFNDHAGVAGDFLEKLLDFNFKLHAQKPRRGKPARATIGVDQELLPTEPMRDASTRSNESRDQPGKSG